MTPEAFKLAMTEIEKQIGDIEAAHQEADDLLCRALCDVGYDEGVLVFRNMHKWYA